MPDPVRIYKGKGVCRGAAEYFIHLCIQSRKWFTAPEEWLKAVSNQFRDGVPGQGVLMQTLFDVPLCFFGYSETRLDNHSISSAELDTGSEIAIQKIKALPPGVYFTGVYKHGLVYIKLSDGSSYTWNPDFGLLKQTAEELLEHIVRHYHEKGQKDSNVKFSRYRLFRWHPFSFLNRSII